VVARAPGRVNLIGEHTDYNGGFVLPCAIDRETVVAVRARTDGMVHVVAVDRSATDIFPARGEVEHSTAGGWPEYVRGMWREVAPRCDLAGGADLAIAGNVPLAAGLSSSASLSVAIGVALNAVAGGALEPVTIAELAQRSENRFVGTNCGIMDPLISATGVARHAILIDCASLARSPVPIPDGVTVLVVDSHVARGLVDSAYNERRAQCEEAARALGLTSLRLASAAMLEAGRADMSPVAARRARHILTENDRTVAAADKLATGDLVTLGAMMAQSHDSMRDDFEITVPAMDALVALMQQAIGRDGGARMTGGGFGGCAVALVPTDAVGRVVEAIAAGYRAPDGRAATVHRCLASNGASVII
jgi:galactokinase